jgi:hypothetical protein
MARNLVVYFVDGDWIQDDSCANAGGRNGFRECYILSIGECKGSSMFYVSPLIAEVVC